MRINNIYNLKLAYSPNYKLLMLEESKQRLTLKLLREHREFHHRQTTTTKLVPTQAGK